MSTTALLIAFCLALHLDGKHHFLSVLLTLGFNKAYFSAFDNYFIIIAICFISAFPELIEKKVNGVVKNKISFNITIKAFLILMFLCWWFGIIDPIKDFKVLDMIIEWFRDLGLSALKQIKGFLFGSWF